MASQTASLSVSDEWVTPQALFDALNAEFDFTLDPCSTHANHKCPRYYTKAEDGLKQDWRDHTVFMNPPFRHIGQWLQKAHAAARAGATVVCLVPARTDSQWWHRHAMKGEIRLLRGRVRFTAGSLTVAIPTAVVIFRPPGHAIVSASLTPTPTPPHPPSPASTPNSI